MCRRIRGWTALARRAWTSKGDTQSLPDRSRTDQDAQVSISPRFDSQQTKIQTDLSVRLQPLISRSTPRRLLEECAIVEGQPVQEERERCRVGQMMHVEGRLALGEIAGDEGGLWRRRKGRGDGGGGGRGCEGGG